MNFYYPVAVGGPVTKTIDQMAADFGKENPDVKVIPISPAPTRRASSRC